MRLKVERSAGAETRILGQIAKLHISEYGKEEVEIRSLFVEIS